MYIECKKPGCSCLADECKVPVGVAHESHDSWSHDLLQEEYSTLREYDPSKGNRWNILTGHEVSSYNVLWVLVIS